MSIISRQQGLRVPVLHRRYLNTVPEAQNNPFREISLSTAYRTLSRANWTTRVPERQHVYVDYEGRVQFLRSIAPFPVERLINWDAMNNSPTSFQNTHAWGPRGIPVVLPQFRLGNKAYTVLAAYTYHGFLAWSVFEGAASGSHVEHFIRATLARYKNADSISFCDNASVNKVDKVLVALDEVFGGLWAFLEAYSPQ